MLLFPLVSPVDTIYLDEGLSGAQIAEVVCASVQRGGVGVARRNGVARPVWGSYRQVKGCGLERFTDAEPGSPDYDASHARFRPSPYGSRPRGPAVRASRT
jgi:hypothetical protein